MIGGMVLSRQLIAIGIGIAVLLLIHAFQYFIAILPWTLIFLITTLTYLGILYWGIKKLDFQRNQALNVTRSIALINVGFTILETYALAPGLVSARFVAISIAAALIMAEVFAYLGLGLFSNKPGFRGWRFYASLVIVFFGFMASGAADYYGGYVPVSVSQIQGIETYEECIDLYGLDGCHDALYDACVDQTGLVFQCGQYIGCLDETGNIDYCLEEFDKLPLQPIEPIEIPKN